MKKIPAAAAKDSNDEIAALVRTLHETQQRLMELTHGEVDAVVYAGDQSYLLREAQEKLRQSETTQRQLAETQMAILNALPAHIALLDSSGKIVSVNDAWRQFATANLLQGPGFGVGQNYLEICERATGDFSEKARATAVGIRRLLQGKAKDFAMEYPCHSPTEQVWFRLVVTTVREGSAAGAVVMHSNVTARKIAEEVLRSSEANMAAAQRIAHLGSWELQLDAAKKVDANPLRWSDEMFRIAGFEPGAVKVTNELFFSLIPEVEHGPIRRAVATAIRDRKQYSIVHRFIRPNGEERIVHELAQVFFDKKTGQPLKLVGTAQDITDTMSYNLANQLLGESFNGGVLNGLAVTNQYDSDLRRTTLSAMASGSSLTTAIYGYDHASRLVSVADAGGNLATNTYLANSPLVSQIVFKQGSTTRMTTTKQYDYLNRLTLISSAPSASYTAPLTFNYNYNAANQRTHNTLADGSYWVYGYDSLGQVTNACKYFADGTPVAGQQFDYTFDTIGNRTQTLAGGDATGANLRTANYYANSLNQITNRDVPPFVDVLGASIFTNPVTVNGSTAYRKEEYFRQQLAVNNTNSALWTNITVSGGASISGNVYVPQEPEVFQYDADGNLTNDGRWAYTWDGENRLISMTNNTGVGPNYKLTFAYDAKGRRIQKIVATNGVAVSTNKFLYDGWNLVAEVNPNNTPVRTYLWGNDLSGSQQGAGGVGGLLEVSYYSGSSTTNCFPAFDGNGNVMALINVADGTVVANYDYGAFGEPIRITGAMGRNNPFRFSTKYDDDESDLLYYGYRYYKPSTGTWPNKDPMEEQGGMNLYGFAGNNSVNLIDTDGKAPTPSSPPAPATPKFITRSVISTKFGVVGCCFAIAKVEWRLTITDATGAPVVGASVSEGITTLAEQNLFSQVLVTGSATTSSRGTVKDTTKATFWICSTKSAFWDQKQDIIIGTYKATFYTDLTPTGLSLATLRAAF
jgi:RHS repeat-associated protein